MATPQDTELSDDERKHIFPFFNLAAELRNDIYDRSLTDISTTLECGVTLEAKEVLATNLLLVNKQFKHEYEDRQRDHASLIFTDIHSLDDAIYLDLPQLPKGISTIHFNLIESYDGHWRVVEKVIDHVKRPVQVTVDMTVDMRSSRYLFEYEYKAWGSFPGLRKIEVYMLPGFINSMASFTLEGAYKWLHFNFETGFFEKVPEYDGHEDIDPYIES